MKLLLRVGLILLSPAAIVFATCNWIAIVDDNGNTACSVEGPGKCSWVKYSSFCESCSLSMDPNDGCIVGDPYTITGTWYIYGLCYKQYCSGGTPDPDIPPQTITCHWVQSELCPPAW